MADLLIKNVSDRDTIAIINNKAFNYFTGEAMEVVVLPPHGRLIDADRLHKSMYHIVFETDVATKWQSGCWVRYRVIEQLQDSAPTVIEASEV